MPPKYKIDQQVRVRPDLIENQMYIDSVTGYTDSVMGNMAKLAGQIVTIQSNNDKYTIAEGSYHWTDSMFESIKEMPKDCTELPNGYYKSFNIPRKNKAPRKIHAPDPELLKYQRNTLKLLETTFLQKELELGIPNIMHGFITDRNCITAAQKHIGFEATLMMDIVAFFDSVTPYHTEIEDPNLYTTENYCGQGFATSPMLANIGILGIVKSIDDYLKELYSDQYAFSIYADDIQISINPNSSLPIYEEINEIIEIVSTAFEYFGFKIHPHKTRIRYAKHGYRKILGINVGDDHIRATRKTIKRLRAAKYQKNGPSAGGLSTWSKCLLPRKLRVPTIPDSQDKEAYAVFWDKMHEQGKLLDFKTHINEETWQYYGRPNYNNGNVPSYWIKKYPSTFRFTPQIPRKEDYHSSTIRSFF